MKRIASLVLGSLMLTMSAASQVVPPITLPPTKSTVFNITKSDDLWYFSGEAPLYPPTSIVLNSVGPTEGQFAWTINNGTATAVLENNALTITQSNIPAVGVNSAGASGLPNDVGIEFKFNGQNVGTYQLTSYAPATVRQQAATVHYASNTLNSVGYYSQALFSIHDQFGAEVTRIMPINEVLVTSARVDDSSNNWPNGVPFSADSGPRFHDTWGFSSERFPVFLPFTSPAPTNPQGPPVSNVKIYHYPQKYFAGAYTNGSGKEIELHNLQMYVDHADVFK